MTLVNEPKPNWGGPWTERKLDAFSKYVWSYLTIMKKFPYWKTIYFDGFAGSGKKSQTTDLMKQLSIEPEEERVYKGSAERVLTLSNDLAFDFYYFIDTRKSSLVKLEKHLNQLPEAQDKTLEFRPGDANESLLALSDALQKKKPSYAALIFLDPFGMQIDWASIASLKGTRSDIWILVPTGVIVNRMLDRKGELQNLKKLQRFFGMEEEEIRKAFYRKETAATLFGEEEEKVSKVLKPIEKIAQLYVDRLGTIWKYVTKQPLRLDNTRGVPIFHFVFASNNRNGLKIAEQIIQKS